VNCKFSPVHLCQLKAKVITAITIKSRNYSNQNSKLKQQDYDTDRFGSIRARVNVMSGLITSIAHVRLRWRTDRMPWLYHIAIQFINTTSGYHAVQHYHIIYH